MSFEPVEIGKVLASMSDEDFRAVLDAMAPANSPDEATMTIDGEDA